MVISKLTQCDWWINWLIKPIISLKPPTFLSKSAVFFDLFAQFVTGLNIIDSGMLSFRKR